MCNYQFFSINKEKIRELFKGLKEFCSKCLPERIKELGMYELYNELIPKLEETSDIGKIMQDDDFCKKFVEVFFPSDIVRIFGGYKSLLSLPSVECNFPVGKYIELPNEFITDPDIDVAITMDKECRPLLAIRVIDQRRQENSRFICYHAKYHNFLLGYWLPGQHSCKTSSINEFNFPKLHLDYGFSLLKDLVDGKIVTEVHENKEQSLQICCPSFAKEKAALKIQGAYRIYQVKQAEEQLKQAKEKLRKSKKPRLK